MTVAELTKVVSTGTLDARDSLEKLSKEMDRTYGGAAIRMMQTFSGQMTQLKANTQLLMTDEGGKAFFNSIKEQLLDLNDFLSSNKAKYYARQLGEGLAKIVLVVKDTVAWFWKWRDVIVAVGTTIAGAYAISKFSSIVQSLSVILAGSVANLRASLRGAAVGLTDMAAGFNGLRTGQHVMTSLGVAAIGLRGAFTALTASIPLIGVGLLGLQFIIGLFNDWEDAADKAKKATDEAYERVKNGGAESYEEVDQTIKAKTTSLENQLGEIREDIRGRQKQIRDAYVIDYLQGFDTEKTLESTLKDLSEQEKETLEELKRVKKSSPDYLLAQKETDMAKGKRAVESSLALSPEAEAANKIYNDRQNQLDAQREKEVQTAIDTGQSIQAVKNKFDRLSIAEQKKVYSARLRIADDERKAIEKRRKDGVIGAWEYKGQIEAVEEYAKKTKEALDNLDVRKLVANTLLSGQDSNNQKIERGVKTLTKMQQALSDTKAEAIGMGDAYATMVAKIQNGTFGNYEGLFGQDLEALQKIHRQLQEIAAEQAFADKQKDGFLGLANDVRQAQREIQNKKIQREIADKTRAEGRNLTRAEIIEIQVNNEGYFGLGSEESIRKQFQEFAESLNKQATLAQQLGEIMRTNTFGVETDQAIQTTADKVKTVNEELKKTASILGGFTFDSFSNIAKSISAGLTGVTAGFSNIGTDIGAAIIDNVTPALNNLPKDVEERMAQAMQHLMGRGLPQVAAAGIVGNLVAESGLDPTIPGDNGNSVGIAQWHKERMVAMKSWITAQGRDWKDMNAQLDFLVHELNTSEKIAGNQLKLAGNPIQAAKTFMDKFERPAEWAKKQSWDKRAAAAQRSYDMAGATQSQLVTIPVIYEFDPKVQNERIEAGLKVTEDFIENIKPKLHNDEMGENIAAAYGLTEQGIYDLQKKMEEISKIGIGASEKIKQFRQAFRDVGVNPDVDPEAIKFLKQYEQVEKQYEVMEAHEKKLIELERDRVRLNAMIAENRKKAANPDWQGESEAMKKINQEFDEMLRKAEEYGLKGSEMYSRILATRQAFLSGQSNLEVAQFQMQTAREEQILQQSLMTKSQLKKANMQRDLALVEEWGRIQIEAGANEVEITEEVERRKSLIRQKYAQEANPVANQMREWKDIQAQLEKSVTGWMDSLADGIAGLITGTGDLRSAIQGIANDIAKMATKWLLSGLFGGSGAGGTKFGKSTPATSMHTGGIVGDGSMLRSMSAITWAGAPKFHSGGLVGGLLPSEVPIVAKKGEGVFTPEQMKAMGGFQQNQVVQVNAPITVNGSSGTPEQNNDLAKKMAREMDGTVRAIIADEMRKQTRPGSLMNTRAR